MQSYETVSISEVKSVSCQHWYFYKEDSKKFVRRECNNIEFFKSLFEKTDPTPHTWYLIANYFNTKVIPFVPYEDYEELNNKDVFNFTTLRNHSMGCPTRVGEYMVWPKMSCNYLGWALYLYVKGNYKLSKYIPLYNHEKLGSFNLISNDFNCLDISCKIFDNDQLIFTNTDKVTDILVFDLISSRNIKVLFGTEHVHTSSNKDWFKYLLHIEDVKNCNFKIEYSFLCDEINFHNIRWLAKPTEHIESITFETNQYGVDKISPCSTFEDKFNNTIDECLKIINDKMIEKSDPALNIHNLLEFYLKNNEYSTFYILIISVWQYCENTIKMENDYTIEDILFFVKVLCHKVGGNNDLFVDNLIYFSNKNTSRNFMKSLHFFVNPSQGVESFFEAVSAYFALHLAIYRKTNSWSINPRAITEAEVDVCTKSIGFYKKVKVGKFDYIFTGSIYENYKNKKEHSIAHAYDSCPEVTVISLLFNETINFYMTQDGMFDVCRKTYREPCPFVVMSTLKKNYIKRDQNYLKADVFKTLYSTIDKDLVLFKVYHARKFLNDYTNVVKNIKDCLLVGSNMDEYRLNLENQWRDMKNWLLEYKASDIVILMLKLETELNQPVKNIVSLPITVDLMGLQVAIVCHLLWPSSKTEIFFWSLLCTTYEDFEDWLDGYEFGDLVKPEIYQNKKKITESMHRILYNYNYNNEDIFNDIKAMILSLDASQDTKYGNKRLIKNIGAEYKKYKKIPIQYNVWTDVLIEHKNDENMYTWLSRFYMRMFFSDYEGDKKHLINVIKGFCYFRVFTNFHVNNSKALINFCASLAIPVDNEKMCIVLSSKPNCGKSSLWELLSTMILVYKQDKEVYKHNKNEKDEKVKLYESQLYVMNEAQRFSKTFLKSIVDNSRTDSARCNYGVMETFRITFKALVCNNDDDKIFVTDGYDKACSNRIGQMYFDHDFDPEIRKFSGSVYEHHIKKRYCEVRDVVTKLKDSVEAFLANVLKHNCNPNDGQLYYKHILQNDNSYKHNKRCLYIYNTRLEALLYVMNVKECKNAPEFSEETLFDLIKSAEKYVTQMLHPSRRNNVTFDNLCIDFKHKYNSSPRFYNADTKMYSNLQLAHNEKLFRHYGPKFIANVDETI